MAGIALLPCTCLFGSRINSCALDHLSRNDIYPRSVKWVMLLCHSLSSTYDLCPRSVKWVILLCHSLSSAYDLYPRSVKWVMLLCHSLSLRYLSLQYTLPWQPNQVFGPLWIMKFTSSENFRFAFQKGCYAYISAYPKNISHDFARYINVLHVSQI